MCILILDVRLVPSRVVTLGLHITHLDVPLFVDLIVPLRYSLVIDKVPKLIKSQVWHAMIVPFEPIHHLWLHDMIEFVEVSSGNILNTLPQEVTIKLHEQSS